MALRSWDGLYRIWVDVGATQQYYPLLHSAFWVEAALWGDAVLGYHLANVLQHAIAACLVVELCKRLSVKGGWLAAFIFALHPVNVESVAWISEQKNTLSLVLYLLAALAYLRFDERRTRRTYAAAIAFFALALLTKTVTATLPAALLVVFWWKRGSIDWRRDVMPLVPWFALAAAAGIGTAWVERRLIGAEGVEFTLGFTQRLMLAARVVWFYLGRLFWPGNLMFTYPRWSVDTRVWWQWAFPVVLLALLVVLWRLRKRTRAPLAGFLIFAGSLFPVLGFFNVYPFRYSFVADHFQYLASLGIIVPVAAGLAGMLEAASQSTTQRATQLLVGGIVAMLGMLTFLQSRMYSDEITLYTATIARNPDDWMAHNNLGRILSRMPGRRDEEIGHYEAVLRLRPEHGRAHYSLGVALFLSGRGPEAIDHFDSALRLEPGNPVLVANAHYFLGLILTNTPGRLNDAIGHLEEAIRLRQDDPERYNALGEAFVKAGRIAEAKGNFETAVRLKPDYAAAKENLEKVARPRH